MSKAPRGKSFTTSELESLLEIIEDILPVGPNEWEAVLARHETRYPDMDRTKESIKRKFSSLYNAKKPTGDPTCPPTVRSAKRIFNMIKEKMDFSDGESGGSDEEEVENGEEEDNEGNGAPQVTLETPSADATVARTNGANVGSGGSGDNAVVPFKMVPSSSKKRKSGSTGGKQESESFDSFLKAMLIKSERDSEMQAMRHKEEMERLEKKERLEEIKSERQDKWMKMMMMHMMQSSSSAPKKKQKSELEVLDDSDSD
jgi:hypothetical protein